MFVDYSFIVWIVICIILMFRSDFFLFIFFFGFLVFFIFFFFFFFSSRRRHTRFDCDWSSDVCSSDLATPAKAVSSLRFATAVQKSHRRDLAKVALPARAMLATLWVNRSEERRVGKECRSRWSAYH